MAMTDDPRELQTLLERVEASMARMQDARAMAEAVGELDPFQAQDSQLIVFPTEEQLWARYGTREQWEQRIAQEREYARGADEDDAEEARRTR